MSQSHLKIPWTDPEPESSANPTPAENTSRPEQLRQRVAFYLEDIETPGGRILNLSIVALVLISSGIFVAQTFALPADVRSRLQQIDQGILLLFAVEYGLRLWSARDRLKYLFCLYSLIDLLAILPFFIVATDIRFIRLLRWFRILRLARFLRGKTAFGYVSSEDGVILVRILFTLFAITFVFAGLIYQVEHPFNPGLETFTDAFYFAIVTMTTVGYGDVTPTSELGRLFTILMILTGIALIPWQVGSLIGRILKTTQQAQMLCSGCGTGLHDTDAQFCKFCGSRLVAAATATAETARDLEGSVPGN